MHRDPVDVLLVGGPEDIPPIHRLSDPTETHLRIERLGGYEHYEPTGGGQDFDGRLLPVFQWTYRTRFAE